MAPDLAAARPRLTMSEVGFELRKKSRQKHYRGGLLQSLLVIGGLKPLWVQENRRISATERQNKRTSDSSKHLTSDCETASVGKGLEPGLEPRAGSSSALGIALPWAEAQAMKMQLRYYFRVWASTP